MNPTDAHLAADAAATRLAAARHLLAWWADAGVDTGHIRLDAPPQPQRPQASQPQPGMPRAPAQAALATPAAAGLQAAEAAAAAATSLADLEQAIAAFEGCALKRTARSTVFADGVAGAPVMLVGEAPGADEDRAGRPFVGKSGQLLDVMLASIGLSRDTNLYITNVVPWRPPGNRTPSRDELAVCRPFVMAHIALARPKLLILAGGAAAQTVLGSSDGIGKLRGHKHMVTPGPNLAAIPAYPILHPAYILRRPGEKALVWKDLLNFVDEMSAADVARAGESGLSDPH